MSPTTVHSADGTPIASWRSGEGDELVLVHGITSTHTTFDEIVPHLSGSRVVTRYDRRGRGGSGDVPDAYDIEREFEDLAAVLDAISEPVDVFAHSFGAYIALGGARLRPAKVRSLVLYSPGFGDAYPEETLQAIDAAIAEDDRDRGLTVLMTDIIGMPLSEVEFMMGSPAWQDRRASAHTVVRECRADEAIEKRLPELAAAVEAPVLVVSGETNLANKRAVAERFAASTPNGSLVLLEGQGHAAHHTGPGQLAEVVLDFTAR